MKLRDEIKGRELLRHIKSVSLAASLCLFPLASVPAWAQNEGHLITMKGADITAFIEDVSVVTGKTFLIDPRIQGKVNIASEQQLTKSEVFQVFKDVMRVNNYTVIPTNNGEYRITLTQNAAQEAPLAYKNGISGQLSTVVMKLNNGDAAEAAKLIRPVVHSQGRLSANPGGKVIIMTDFPENIAKARAIIEAVDVDDEQYDTVRLAYLSALEAEAALKSLQGPRPDVRIVAVPATNSIVFQGSGSSIAKIKPILVSLDQPRQGDRSGVSVVPLRFADGENILSLLTSLLPAFEEEGKPIPTVAHEAGSNKLVISASPDVQDAMAEIIRQLDQRRPQVLVEALIVEITDSTARELGVQFGVAGLNGSNVPLFTSNFNRSAPNLLALTGALAGPNLGLDEATTDTLAATAVGALTGTGLSGGTFGFASTGNDAVFSAIINAVDADTDSNILSTPFVTTLDNIPASFLVGQEIPITTGQTLGADNANPFNTVERQDVGIKLDVTPQISEGNVIRLEIDQEVSSVDSIAAIGLTTDFVINTREISTTVLADDGEIIVLGGLLQDDEQISAEKIPYLGDIPVVGNLFKSEGRTRAKTNLMVFLRPTIIRTAEDARPLTQRRLQQAKQLDRAYSGRPVSKIDEFLQEP